MASGTLKRLHRLGVQSPRTSLLAPVLARLAGRGKRLLDVGAGGGEVAARVAEISGAAEVRGVDVHLQPELSCPVSLYDGRTLPFERGAFDVVLLSDVLHHAEDPAALLREALRVAAEAVLVKDHYAFGPVSRTALLAMDLVANGFYGIGVRGTYLEPGAWHALATREGARLVELVWPLHVHDPWLRVLTRSELQFAARYERGAA